MLIGNQSVLNKFPLRQIGGNSTAVTSGIGQASGSLAAGRMQPDNWKRFGMQDASGSLTSGTVVRYSAKPYGYYPPGAWGMAITAGGMSSYQQVTGTGNISPLNLAGGVNGVANISGSGTISSAVGQLVISMLANISGSGDITSANVNAILNASANLTGSGAITAAAIQALAWATANISGAGDASATPHGVGTLAANILSYGTLTPEGIRDTVWQAVLSNYPTSGTAGATLAAAGSGGVDYTALGNAVWAHAIEAGYSAEQIVRLMAAVLDGTVSGAGSGTETFTGLDGTTARITATVDSSGNRTSITKNAA